MNGKQRAAVWWLVLVPGVAQAEPSRAEQADQLFREGREAMKRQDHLGACNKFHASQKLDPAPGTALSIAECEEALERLAVAHRFYGDVLEKLPATDERAELARRQRSALESRMGRVSLSNISSKYTYRIELYTDAGYARRAATSPAESSGVWVAPGTYRILLLIEGKELKIPGEVQVKAGEQKRVEYRAPGSPGQESHPVPVPETQEGLRTGTVVALVGGGSMLLGGALWQYGARQRDSALALCPSYAASGGLECTQQEEANEQLSRSRTWRTTGQVLTGAGALALVVGLLMNLKASEKKKQVIQIQPWSGPLVGLSGASVEGTW